MSLSANLPVTFKEKCSGVGEIFLPVVPGFVRYGAPPFSHRGTHGRGKFPAGITKPSATQANLGWKVTEIMDTRVSVADDEIHCRNAKKKDNAYIVLPLPI
jgi:hypothetical protein